MGHVAFTKDLSSYTVPMDYGHHHQNNIGAK